MQRGDSKQPEQLGKMLVAAGMITEAALKQALAYQKKNPPASLPQALTDTGVMTGREVAGALAIHLDMPFLPLDRIIPPAHILSLVPAQIARTHGLIPVARINQQLVVAVSAPLEPQMMEKLLAAVDTPVHLALAPETELFDLVHACYGEQQQTTAFAGPEVTHPVKGRPEGVVPRPRRASTGIPSPQKDIFGIRRGRDPDGGREKTSRPAFEGLLSKASRSFSVNEQALVPDSTPYSGSPAPAVDPEAVRHFEKGLAAARSGAYQEALAAFEEALRLDEGNRVYQANIGRLRKILAEKEK